MENKTSWEWHKEKHLVDNYMMIRNKPTWQRFPEESPHIVSTYPLTPNNYGQNKKPDEPKNF
jgi:hypothetical protein